MDTFAAGVLFGMCLGVLWADRAKISVYQKKNFDAVRWQNILDQVEAANDDIERLGCRRRHPTARR